MSKNLKTFTPKTYRKPVDAGEVLSNTFKHLHLKDKIAQYAAFPHWPEVVGIEHAKVSFPEKLISGKVLVVRVVDAAWAQELTLVKKEILDKIHDLGIGAIIEDIRFTIGNPTMFNEK